MTTTQPQPHRPRPPAPPTRPLALAYDGLVQLVTMWGAAWRPHEILAYADRFADDLLLPPARDDDALIQSIVDWLDAGVSPAPVDALVKLLDDADAVSLMAEVVANLRAAGENRGRTASATAARLSRGDRVAAERLETRGWTVRPPEPAPSYATVASTIAQRDLCRLPWRLRTSRQIVEVVTNLLADMARHGGQEVVRYGIARNEFTAAMHEDISVSLARWLIGAQSWAPRWSGFPEEHWVKGEDALKIAPPVSAAVAAMWHSRPALP